jgi:hypothetical protein
MKIVQQTQWPRETGRPRDGCWSLSLIAAPFRAVGRLPRWYEADRIYNELASTKALTWRDGEKDRRPIIEVGPSPRYKLYTNNSDAVLRIAGGYASPGMVGRLYQDRPFYYPDVPRNHPVDMTLVSFNRPKASEEGTVHWMLFDRYGLDLLFNPDVSLDVDPWDRAGRWFGIVFEFPQGGMVA